jgi:hypothetical protein
VPNATNILRSMKTVATTVVVGIILALPSRARPSCPSLAGGLRVWVKVGDISLSGCYLQTSEPFEVGRHAELLIDVADTRIEAYGIVRFSDSKSGMGVGFTHVSPASLRKLTHLIAQLERAGGATVKEFGSAPRGQGN